jgi:hypothetical protein
MLLFVVVGCGSSSWIETPTCGLDAYGWSDDLLAHILAGDGSGAFSYDPVDAPRVSVDGAYDPSSGDFTWTELYDSDYYLSSREVEGYGTAYHDGDLDVLYTITTVDILDDESATDVRFKREGCGADWWSWPTGDDSTILHRTGEYNSATSFRWTAEDDTWDYEGELSSDLASSITYDAKDGNWEQTSETGNDGVSHTTFSGATYCLLSDTECEGETTIAFDGGEHYTATATSGGDAYAELDGTFKYNGDGVLTIDYAQGVSCDYTFDAGGCDTYSCDDGQKGSCS